MTKAAISLFRFPPIVSQRNEASNKKWCFFSTKPLGESTKELRLQASTEREYRACAMLPSGKTCREYFNLPVETVNPYNTTTLYRRWILLAKERRTGSKGALSACVPALRERARMRFIKEVSHADCSMTDTPPPPLPLLRPFLGRGEALGTRVFFLPLRLLSQPRIGVPPNDFLCSARLARPAVLTVFCTYGGKQRSLENDEAAIPKPPPGIARVQFIGGIENHLPTQNEGRRAGTPTQQVSIPDPLAPLLFFPYLHFFPLTEDSTTAVKRGARSCVGEAPFAAESLVCGQRRPRCPSDDEVQALPLQAAAVRPAFSRFARDSLGTSFEEQAANEPSSAAPEEEGSAAGVRGARRRTLSRRSAGCLLDARTPLRHPHAPLLVVLFSPSSSCFPQPLYGPPVGAV
ncbi:hypothetical protein HPB48_016028 [Haemaphysalis longicornis]|uniref:Uncharacterized protein n=1 Tax=Haemaphysalis longicornis TaxID=44386 RepID=A0A9J6G387_HAELO|nr:hypothetical protein HPB48_016028 [Haemaphysalis longicornis]